MRGRLEEQAQRRSQYFQRREALGRTRQGRLAFSIQSPLMDWVISSREEATGRVSAAHYATETSFQAALKDMFSDLRSRFVSAELPDGSVLDEDAARELVGAPHGSSWQ